MCVDTDMGLGMGKLCNIIDMQGLGFTCDRYVCFWLLQKSPPECHSPHQAV